MSYSTAGAYSVSQGPLNILGAGQQLPRDIAINDGVTLTVKHATGGWVVQIHQYNTAGQPLYVIHDDADFDKELGKIITLNCLKANND